MDRLPSIEQLKEMRKYLGWSQAKLAKEAKVSRPLLNKMELGRRIPNYKDVTKIAECLQGAIADLAGNARSLAIGRICSPDLDSIDIRRSVEDAKDKMIRGSFSHLPVFDGDKLVGTITEASLLRLLPRVENKGPSAPGQEPIAEHREVIAPAYPCLDEHVSMSDAWRVIMRRGAVLVMREGRIKGIATKSDLLKHLLPESRPPRLVRSRGSSGRGGRRASSSWED